MNNNMSLSKSNNQVITIIGGGNNSAYRDRIDPNWVINFHRIGKPI